MSYRPDACVWPAIFALFTVLALLGACGGGGSTDAAVAPDAAVPRDCSAGDAAAGERAVASRGCAGCHGTDLGGATRGSPGQNLTPSHLEVWSDFEIAAAILDGRGRDGAPLCPSMTRFRALGMTGAQTCDVVAHLRSLAPITRDVVDTCM